MLHRISDLVFQGRLRKRSVPCDWKVDELVIVSPLADIYSAEPLLEVGEGHPERTVIKNLGFESLFSEFVHVHSIFVTESSVVLKASPWVSQLNKLPSLISLIGVSFGLSLGVTWSFGQVL